MEPQRALGGKEPQASSLLPPLPWARTPSTTPACSELHPGLGLLGELEGEGCGVGQCQVQISSLGMGVGGEAAGDLRVLFSFQVAFRAARFPAAFNLDYYTEVLDLSYLVDHLASDPFFRNYRRLNEKLVEVIEDYSLVSFVPLNVQVTQQEGTGSLGCAAAAFCLLRAGNLSWEENPGWKTGKRSQTCK